MDKIFTATDRARELGFTSNRELIQSLANARHLVISPKSSRSPVKARIDFGRWIADCPCGGASYVDPADPIFFCTTCGNKKTGGGLRPVKFPEDYQEIEQALLKIQVVTAPELAPTQAAMYAKPLKSWLQRSWSPGESLADLLQRIGGDQ